MLADLGADVIQIEPPGGSPARRLGPFAGDVVDPERSLFWWSYARNKRGITLDVAHPRGREVFRRLVRTADFVVDSELGWTTGTLGVDHDTLAAINPRIVTVSITPFGE